MNMSWERFKEILRVMSSVSQAKSNGIDDGELHNSEVSAAWNENGVQIDIDQD